MVRAEMIHRFAMQMAPAAHLHPAHRNRDRRSDG